MRTPVLGPYSVAAAHPARLVEMRFASSTSCVMHSSLAVDAYTAGAGRTLQVALAGGAVARFDQIWRSMARESAPPLAGSDRKECGLAPSR